MLRGEFIERHAGSYIRVPHYQLEINIDDAKLNDDQNAATITRILGRLYYLALCFKQ